MKRISGSGKVNHRQLKNAYRKGTLDNRRGEAVTK